MLIEAKQAKEKNEAGTKSPVRLAIDKLIKVGEILNEYVYERESETEGILISLLTGSSCLFLGAPGAGKTHHVELACRLVDMPVFDILISETTKPDTIFGPPDIPALAKGIQRNKIEGYAPKAEVLFFDEIFKASGIVLNPLLWLVNEHKFRNGDEGILKCPTKAVFAASNEIPSEEALKPIYDRFILRYNVKYIRSSVNLNKMIDLESGKIPKSELTHKELMMLRDVVKTVEIPGEVRDTVFALRDQCTRAASVIISDRRLVKSFRVLQAVAMLRGRKIVKLQDISILANIFWDTFEQTAKVRQLVMNASNAKLSDIMSYEELAEELWQKAIKTGDLDGACTRLEEMYGAVSKLKSAIGITVAKVIDSYIQRIKTIQSKRNDFIIMELRDAENQLWYKLSASCESFWSQKQLRSVRFRWSRKHGYWWREGPKKNKQRIQFRADWSEKIEKKLGVKASFSKMV